MKDILRQSKTVVDPPLSVTCPEEGEHALVQSWEEEEGRRGGGGGGGGGRGGRRGRRVQGSEGMRREVKEGKEKEIKIPFSSQTLEATSKKDTSSIP